MVEYFGKNHRMYVSIRIEVVSWKISCTNILVYWTSYASKIFGRKGAWTVHQKEGMVQERGDESRDTLCV